MQIRNTIIEQRYNSRSAIVHVMTNISGRETLQAEIFLLIILGYIVLMLLLFSIHRRLLKKQKKNHENLVFLYDTIRYQLAKTQYETTTNQENKGINKVIDSQHKTYLANATIIKQEILAIEQQNEIKIVSEDQRNILHKQTQKKNRLTIIVQVIGRITTLLTVGIYKLFR